MSLRKQPKKHCMSSVLRKRLSFSNNKLCTTHDLMLVITTLHPHPPKTCSTFTVSAPPSYVSAVYPLNKSSSCCRLSEFLPFASAVQSQLAQLSSLSPAKQPICKDRGRVKERNREKRKGEENQRMEMRRKRERETDCFDNVDCQELHSV